MTRTFYAMHDRRTPALVNIGVAVVNIVGGPAARLRLDWGVTGLALGHAVSYVFGPPSPVRVCEDASGPDGARIGRTIAKTLLAAALTAAAAAGASAAVGTSWTRPTFARLVQVTAAFAGVLVFLARALIFGSDEVDEVKEALLGRLRRGA